MSHVFYVCTLSKPPLGRGYTTNTKMKKVLYLLIVCLVALSSCKKEDNGTPGSLQGTVWKTPGEGELIQVTFHSGTRFSEYYHYKTYEYTDYGTYTYNPPVITFQFEDGYTLSGTIEGNVLDYNGAKLVKQ